MYIANVCEEKAGGEEISGLHRQRGGDFWRNWALSSRGLTEQFWQATGFLA